MFSLDMSTFLPSASSVRGRDDSSADTLLMVLAVVRYLVIVSVPIAMILGVRVSLESIIVLFRISEDVAAIRENGLVLSEQDVDN